MNKAVVLFSGGLDSTTTLYYAKSKGYTPYCLIFDYGQRHKKEILNAKKIAKNLRCEYKVVALVMPWKGSSLLDKKQKIPTRKKVNNKDIPSTYVPSRNIIFLSLAASYAETIGAKKIFIGANAVDYSGYPDCRPEFIKSFQSALNKGIKVGVKGRGIKISAPLIRKTKAQIISLGTKLKVPFHLTWSCYKGGKLPCGKCDSCVLRKAGFDKAGLKDTVKK